MVATRQTGDGAAETQAGWSTAPDDVRAFPLVRRIIRDYVGPRRAILALAIGSMVLVAITTGALPLLLNRIIEDIFLRKAREMVYLLPAIVLLVMGLRSMAEYFASVTEASIGNRLVADLRAQLFVKLAGADLSFLQRTHSAKFVAVFMNDAQVVNLAAAHTLSALANNLLQVLFLAGVMIFMDPALGLIIVTAMPIGLFLLRRQRKKVRTSVDRTLEGTGDLSTIVSQTLTGIRVVKAYDREKVETARAHAAIERTYGSQMQTARARAISGPIAEGFAGLGLAAAIFYGGLRGIDGSLALGEFTAFITAVLLAYRPLKSLAGLSNVLYEGLVAARRVFAILDEDSHVREKPGARPLAIKGGSLRFDNVTFAYVPEQAVVRDLTLDIPAGHKVALVGPSGAGKSTLIHLALRFFDPEAGRVLIDGQDIAGATIASVRLASALLTQDPVVFDDTVRANIAYGSEDATEEEVIAAARAADAHGFIAALPKGYDTRLGEAGGTLSGGQKQRIAIARAILRGAPILLLDEPTSALDAEAEARIQHALDQLFADRTVLMIAHRLSTVQRADLICVMDHGRIVESGTHAELVARGGLYADLYRTQVAGERRVQAAGGG